jgi:RNA-directed DNA polymerase
MQAKLHRWAAADPGRRFDDLFNLVYDPATLSVAFARVAGQPGREHPRRGWRDGRLCQGGHGRARVPGRPAGRPEGRLVPATAGSGTDDPRAGRVGEAAEAGHPGHRGPGGPGRAEAGAGTKFEADFKPVSYRFRPKRRAQDAIAEIHYYDTRDYRWVLDADIEAAFGNVSHTAVMDRVRARVKDKRVLALVKAFLKAEVLTEPGEHRDTLTGTPQGGILSPLIST